MSNLHETTSASVAAPSPGDVVRCRTRDWILLPNDDSNLLLLRPLVGASGRVVGVRRDLAEALGAAAPYERPVPSSFPPPRTGDLGDPDAAAQLWRAAQLTLRDGAAPLRCFGRIAFDPAPYQLVPLLMALRLERVRLLIADDVGVGKTLEAALIARELLDRNEIRRFCVLCPSHLCAQWEAELRSKFNLSPAVVTSATVRAFESESPTERPYAIPSVLVAALDVFKFDRRRERFLADCPELVIIDEAHLVASGDDDPDRHLRHALARAVAAVPDRGLILLTATPHSGVASAFQSLLGLLHPEFGDWDTGRLTEAQRVTLARHFVQRTRGDIRAVFGGGAPFPRRETTDLTYTLSPAYRGLFDAAYALCRDVLPQTEEEATGAKRARYWGALALLRCLMSSPAAGAAALRLRRLRIRASQWDAAAGDVIDFLTEALGDGDENRDDDEPPSAGLLPEPDSPLVPRFNALLAACERLAGSDDDAKLLGCVAAVRELLQTGRQPVVWCRYVATATYVAEQLQARLGAGFPGLQVVCVTGRMRDEDRRRCIEEIRPDRPRVLVATDCLSEGVNLQHLFTAVLHYDLPWNPNRLDQREGRIDRYGQTSSVVSAIRYYAPDNPVDGVVVQVLLRKADEIYRTLGIAVPAPNERESVTAALLNALFLRRPAAPPTGEQLTFVFTPEQEPSVLRFHAEWEDVARRERVSRSRFAQRALHPEKLQPLLDAAREVFGSPATVRDFFVTALTRFGLDVVPEPGGMVWRVTLTDRLREALPFEVRSLFPSPRGGCWRIAFESSSPPGADFLHRNHPVVWGVADYLMRVAFKGASRGVPQAARCAVVPVASAARRAVAALFRGRYLVHIPDRRSFLMEETFTLGWRWDAEGWHPLSQDETVHLVNTRPVASLSSEEQTALLNAALGFEAVLMEAASRYVASRADVLTVAQKEVRSAAGLSVRGVNIVPHPKPDWFGIVVYTPLSA